MLGPRMYKRYEFASPPSRKNQTSCSRIRASESGCCYRVEFTSYPGNLQSTDDWYTLPSTGLVVTETSNNVFNTELNREYTKPESVSEWIRAIVANRLATDGLSWVQAFCKHNSGTYNNGWIIANVGALDSRPTGRLNLPDGFLWLAEPLPGSCVNGDITDTLRRDSYFASYNIPYFSAVNELSGNLRMEQEYGSLFNRTTYARAVLFRELLSSTTASFTLESLQRVIRYNDWQRDNASTCPGCYPDAHNPVLTISARGDLIPLQGLPGVASNGSWGKWAPFVEGLPNGNGAKTLIAIDGKVTSAAMVRNAANDDATSIIVAGPTHERQPVFNWNTSWYSTMGSGVNSHLGQATVQGFQWVTSNHWN